MQTPAALQQRLRAAFNDQQAALLAEVVTEAYAELVKTHDFNELKEIVRDLAQAQARTEQRLDTLTAQVDTLAQAQTRTEQRLDELAQAQTRTEQRLDELAQAQTRTEQRVDTLTERVDALAQAQIRTEQRVDTLTERVDALAQAQTRTEQRVEELAIDLRRLTTTVQTLAETVQTLAEGQQDLRQQLGGLAMTVGYVLENEAYKALPALLERDYGLVVSTPLKRGYVTDRRGRSLEVNILGEGTQDNTLVTILGESKAQLSIPAIQRFIRTRLEPLRDVFPNIFPILITHMVSSPDVETYAQEQGIALYYSYQF